MAQSSRHLPPVQDLPGSIPANDRKRKRTRKSGLSCFSWRHWTLHDPHLFTPSNDIITSASSTMYYPLFNSNWSQHTTYVEQQETRIAETILERLEHPTAGTDCEDGFQGDVAYLFHESRPFEHSRDTSVDPCAQALHHGYSAIVNKDGIIISIDIDWAKKHIYYHIFNKKVQNWKQTSLAPFALLSLAQVEVRLYLHFAGTMRAAVKTRAALVLQTLLIWKYLW